MTPRSRSKEKHSIDYLHTNRFLPSRDASIVDQCDDRSDCGRRSGRPAVDGDGAVIDVHEHVSIIVVNRRESELVIRPVCTTLGVRKRNRKKKRQLTR